MEQDQMKELRELIEFLKANGIAEFDMERPDLKVRLKFAGMGYAESSLIPQQPGSASTASAPGIPPAPATQPLEVSPAAEVLHEVRSPLVGTFYESSSPGAAPFVKIGDQVEAGQVLCIIEAMKLMNEVEADVAGEVVQRIAVSGQPVEYGQPLFSVRPR